MSFFPVALNGLRPTHRSPVDFSVAFTTNVTVTITGAPYTVADTNCTVAYLYYKPTGGTWQEPLVNGINGVSIVALNNVLTVTGAGTPFATGDQYLIGLIEQEKGHIAVQNAQQNTNLNPEHDWYTPSTLAEVTNGADNTYYYYVDMSTYRKAGFQFILEGGSGTVTGTIEGTLQDDGTIPASCTYDDITNDLFGVASITASGTWIDDAGALGLFKYARIKIVASTGAADDADWTIFHKRLY